MRPQLTLAALIIPMASCRKPPIEGSRESIRKIDCREGEEGFCGRRWMVDYRDLMDEIAEKTNANATFKNGDVLGCRLMAGMRCTGYCAYLQKFKKKEIPGVEVKRLAYRLGWDCAGCGTAWSKADGPNGGGLTFNFFEGINKKCSGPPGRN